MTGVYSPFCHPEINWLIALLNCHGNVLQKLLGLSVIVPLNAHQEPIPPEVFSVRGFCRSGSVCSDGKTNLEARERGEGSDTFMEMCYVLLSKTKNFATRGLHLKLPPLVHFRCGMNLHNLSYWNKCRYTFSLKKAGASGCCEY